MAGRAKTQLVEPTTVREVKECFVLSDKAKGLANRNREDFQKGLYPLKESVWKMSDSELDSYDALRTDPRRVKDYNRHSWVWGALSIDEIGVWPGAAGLP